MIAIRVLLALPIAIAGAAIAATFLLLGLQGDLGSDVPLSLIVKVTLIGGTVTAAGWVPVLLVVLPLVTHRVRRGKPLSGRLYYGLALNAGMFATLPALVLMNSWEVMPAMLACGATGGIVFAALWRLLVLKPLAVRRDRHIGASLA